MARLRKILASRELLCLSIALMLYGLFTMTFKLTFFLHSPGYAEGMLFAGVGLGVLLGRHEEAISSIREDIRAVREDIEDIKEILRGLPPNTRVSS